MVIPVASIGGRFAGRFGHRPLLVAGGLLYAIAQWWMRTRIGSEPNFLGTWFPAQIWAGLRSGAAVANLAPARYGVGGAVNNALRQAGGAVGAALTVALVGRVGATLEQFRTVYAMLAGLGVLTALLCMSVDTRPKATPSNAT